MKIPPIVKHITSTIFEKCAKDVGSTIIVTTLFGWAASSAAQIIGIARNPKYTKEQKSFMIPQEIGDALVNMGAYFAITYPMKRLATKMVSTGKIGPAVLINLAKRNGDGRKLGNLNFDITKTPYFLEKPYNSFHNFMSTSAAVVGGILSSNIITPILRNRFAAKRQTKVMERLNNNEKHKIDTTSKTTITIDKNPFIYMQTTQPTKPQQTQTNTPIRRTNSSAFDTFRTQGMKI